MALITKTDVENKLNRTLSSSETNSFTVINAQLQALVEKWIGSSVESVSLSGRYYDGGVQHLAIDPCTGVTEVALVNDDNSIVEVLDSSDYTIEPVNRTLKTMIRHRSKFSTGINNVKVTAKFSVYDDSNILAIVKNSLINAVASELVNSSNIKRESIEGYSVEYITNETKDSLNAIKYIFAGV
jgi:hypothetical protein